MVHLPQRVPSLTPTLQHCFVPAASRCRSKCPAGAPGNSSHCESRLQHPASAANFVRRPCSRTHHGHGVQSPANAAPLRHSARQAPRAVGDRREGAARCSRHRSSAMHLPAFPTKANRQRPTVRLYTPVTYRGQEISVQDSPVSLERKTRLGLTSVILPSGKLFTAMKSVSPPTGSPYHLLP